MDDEIDRLVVSVRADTAAFKNDVASMRGTLEDGLGKGADKAGRAIETGLARAIRSGKLGFDDLKKVALAALADIAASSITSGLGALLGGGAGGGGGLIGGAGKLLGAVLGLPGRATGGPVSPGAAYLVGERGPELFVPTTSGSVRAASGGGARDVRVAISIDASGDAAPAALARSGRQVARAVKRALAAAER